MRNSFLLIFTFSVTFALKAQTIELSKNKSLGNIANIEEHYNSYTKNEANTSNYKRRQKKHSIGFGCNVLYNFNQYNYLYYPLSEGALSLSYKYLYSLPKNFQFLYAQGSYHLGGIFAVFRETTHLTRIEVGYTNRKKDFGDTGLDVGFGFANYFYNNYHPIYVEKDSKLTEINKEHFNLLLLKFGFNMSYNDKIYQNHDLIFFYNLNKNAYPMFALGLNLSWSYFFIPKKRK